MRTLVWLVTGLVLGVLACSGSVGPGDAGSDALAEAGPGLLSVSVSPAMATVDPGGRAQLAATLAFTNGTSRVATTGEVGWTSGDTNVAEVDSAGVVRARAPGRATITASAGAFQGFAIVTVNGPRTMTGVRVMPAMVTVTCGQNTQLMALALYSDGSSAALTSGVEWASSAAAVASVDGTGRVLGLAAGETDITAAAGGFRSEPAQVSVMCLGVAVVTVTPAHVTLVAGDTAPTALHADATLANGTHVDVTDQATWTSSAPTIASVSNTPGTRGQVRASATQTGSAQVSATFGGVVSMPSTVDVVASTRLVSIAVTPATASVCPGMTQSFSATGTYADGHTADLTSMVAWSSSAASIATINATTGVAAAVASGMATITAALAGVEGTAPLTVVASTITRIEVTPVVARVTPWAPLVLTATAFYSCGDSRVLTTGVSWSSSSPSIATVDAMGSVSFASFGVVTITAAVGSVRGMATVTSGGPTVRLVTVTPSNPTIGVGRSQQLTAEASLADGSTVDVTRTATWTSAMPGVVSVSSTGLATGVCPGTSSVVVSATIGGATGSTMVTPDGFHLVRIDVTPTPASMLVGATQTFTASGFYTAGAPRDLTNDPSVVWSSSDPLVATVSNATGSRGVVSALSAGSAEIRAVWSDTVCATPTVPSTPATLTVTAP